MSRKVTTISVGASLAESFGRCRRVYWSLANSRTGKEVARGVIDKDVVHGDVIEVPKFTFTLPDA